MEKEILQVRMLGGFSMVYQEKTLVFDRNYISKSTQLLQILFLHLEKGIAKERLLEELYGRDDVENRNGSLNNTIFRLRKQLEAAGLPEGKYFYLKKGIYYWDSVIPVETDLSVFEKKLEESRKETDEEKKTELLKETCALYTGELLPNMTGENWAAVANIHYRDLYFEALEELCTILKEKRYFETIYQLATTAAGMYPFEEWQLWRIDSLIAMNRYQDAMAIYKEATKHFLMIWTSAFRGDAGALPAHERPDSAVRGGTGGDQERPSGKRRAEGGLLLLFSEFYRHLSCDRPHDGAERDLCLYHALHADGQKWRDPYGNRPEQGGFGGLKSCDLQFSQARRFLHQIQRKPVSGHAFRDDSGELPGALGQN